MARVAEQLCLRFNLEDLLLSGGLAMRAMQGRGRKVVS